MLSDRLAIEGLEGISGDNYQYRLIEISLLDLIAISLIGFIGLLSSIFIYFRKY